MVSLWSSKYGIERPSVVSVPRYSLVKHNTLDGKASATAHMVRRHGPKTKNSDF